MSRKVVAWVVLATAVGTTTYVVGTTTSVAAQNRSQQPRVLTGNDIGFRVEGTDFRGRPVGTWVVRMDGNWVEVGAAGGVHPATK